MKVLLALLNLAVLETVTGFTTFPAATTATATAAAATRTTELFASKLDGRAVDGEIKPLNNFLLVKTAKAIDETEGGILLTGKAKIEKTEGTVVSVGPGRTHPDSGTVFAMPVSAGDGVVYGKFDGTEIDVDGEKHTLIRDDDILVKYTGDALTLDSVDVTNDYVLVEVDLSDQTTDGGILIARSSEEEKRPSQGTVVKVGPGRMAADGSLMAMQVEAGDVIKFRDYAGNEVKVGEGDYTVVKMEDILVKF